MTPLPATFVSSEPDEIPTTVTPLPVAVAPVVSPEPDDEDEDDQDEAAEGAELRDLARALEAEPESASAYAALTVARARKGLPEPIARKPVSLMSVAEVVNARNVYPSNAWGSPEYRRYTVLQERKEEIDDEIAGARAIARRGIAPDPSWLAADAAAIAVSGPEDPRLSAWKAIAWDRARSVLGTFHAPGSCPSHEELCRLETALGRTLTTVTTLRKQLEAEGVPLPRKSPAPPTHDVDGPPPF